MMKTWKRILAMCVMVAIFITTTACGNGQFGNKKGFKPRLDKDAKVTISVVGGFGNFEALEETANKFQNYYPGIEVVYTTLNDYNHDLKNRFATGEDIDIFMNDWLDFNMNEKGFIYENSEDLNKVDIDFKKLNKNYLDFARQDGKLYAVPVYLQNYGMMVNENILKEAGVKVPENYTEFITCCNKLKKKGYKTPILIHPHTYGRLFFNYYIENLNETVDALQSFSKTLMLAEDFSKLSLIHEDSEKLEDDYNALILRFLQGDIPFCAISLGSYSGVKKREAKSEKFTAQPFKYNYIPSPITRKKNVTSMNRLGMIFMGVYKHSKHIDYVNEFIRYLVSDEGIKTMSKVKHIPMADDSTLKDFPYLLKAKKTYMTGEEGLRKEAAGLEGLFQYRFTDKKKEKTMEIFKEFYGSYSLESRGNGSE